MKFKGDIIITDPCYFIKNQIIEMPKEIKILEPKEKDYFSYEHERQYPDAIEVDPNNFNETDLVIINHAEHFFSIKKGEELYSKLKEINAYPKRSSKFKEEEKKYLEAYHKWRKPYLNDWEKTYGKDLDILGFTSYLSSSTFYGDWGCTTYNSDTKEILGKFCADSGMVCVVLLDEILKYNSNYNQYITHPWTATLIKDFDGNIEFKITEIDNDKQLNIIGKGNINFITHQTSL